MITGRTAVYAIIGSPLGHSLTPLAINTGLAGLNHDGVSVPFEVAREHLGEVVGAFRRMGLAGFVVTAPHKRGIVEHVDSMDPTVEALGAANVVKVEGGRLLAFNNDGRAFLRAMVQEGGVRPEGAEIALVGAGGAAHALARELTLAGAKVYVLNRTLARAKALEEAAAKWGAADQLVAALRIGSPEAQRVLASAEVVINATSAGLGGVASSPVELPETLRARLACDLRYSPMETRFLAMARDRGVGTLNGLAMMVQSNADSIQLWTGRLPAMQPMQAAVRAVLEKA